MPKPRRIALDWTKLFAFAQAGESGPRVADARLLRLDERLGAKIGEGKVGVRRD